MTRELGEILSGQPEQASEAIVEPVAAPVVVPPDNAAGADGAAQVDGAIAPTADDEPEVRSGMVPHSALHASRQRAKEATERAQAAEREAAEARGREAALREQLTAPKPTPVEPPKPVEFWEDPKAFVEQALTPYQQELLATRVELSHTRAISSFGADAVTAAETAMQEAIKRGELNGEQVAAQLKASRDPVGDVVRWHKDSPAVKEAALRAQIEAELQAKYGQPQPAAEPAPAPPAIPSVMPSDLVGARNVGTRSGPAWAGPAPLNDIFDRGRKKAG